jgi:hypothetical protein
MIHFHPFFTVTSNCRVFSSFYKLPTCTLAEFYPEITLDHADKIATAKMAGIGIPAGVYYTPGGYRYRIEFRQGFYLEITLDHADKTATAKMFA